MLIGLKIINRSSISSFPAIIASPALLFLCLWTSVPAYDQNFWQQANRPFGGMVYLITVHLSGPAAKTGQIFAAASGGSVFDRNDNVKAGKVRLNVFDL